MFYSYLPCWQIPSSYCTRVLSLDTVPHVYKTPCLRQLSPKLDLVSNPNVLIASSLCDPLSHFPLKVFGISQRLPLYQNSLQYQSCKLHLKATWSLNTRGWNVVSSWWGGVFCGDILRGGWSLRGLAGGEWAQCGLWIMNAGSFPIWRGCGVPASAKIQNPGNAYKGS